MHSINATAVRAPEKASAIEREFAISEWKAYTKNTLRGFFTLTMPSGMILHGCSLHEKGDSRWVGMPTEKFAKQDGTTGYKQLIEFASREARDDFNAAVIRAIDQFLRGQR